MDYLRRVTTPRGFEASSVSLARVYFFFTQLPPPLRGRAAVMVGLSNKANYIIRSDFMSIS